MASDGAARSIPCLLVLVALVTGCEGPPPEQVKLELPELVLSQDPVRATVHVRRNGASSVASEKAAFSVSPAGVARVDASGNVFCLASGDAKLTATIQGVAGVGATKCRLVERVEVPELPTLDLGKAPLVVNARALGEKGAELSDVPVTLTTENPHLVSVSGNTLTPLAVGVTALTVRAGARSRRVPLRVVRTIEAEPMALENGRRVYFGLPAGKYEVEVELPVEKELAIEWRGAPYCSYKGSGRTHVSSCTLEGKGGAVVDNPAFLLSGDTTVSTRGISLREVP